MQSLGRYFLRRRHRHSHIDSSAALSVSFFRLPLPFSLLDLFFIGLGSQILSLGIWLSFLLGVLVILSVA